MLAEYDEGTIKMESCSVKLNNTFAKCWFLALWSTRPWHFVSLSELVGLLTLTWEAVMISPILEAPALHSLLLVKVNKVVRVQQSSIYVKRSNLFNTGVMGPKRCLQPTLFCYFFVPVLCEVKYLTVILSGWKPWMKNFRY